MEEEIQKKYKQLDRKMEFIKELAAELGKQPRSIQSNWFAGFKIIPKKYQKKVLEFIEKKLTQDTEK